MPDREAERERIFEEYRDRVGELVSGTIRRLELGKVIVDLGAAEGTLPLREQPPEESYRPGDRLQAIVLQVLRQARGPQVILSRASVSFLTKLFAAQVPEIAQGLVLIESAARDPGSRSKIAVSSRDPELDPVGACLGEQGSRVRWVAEQLGGETVEVVRYEDDPVRFVAAALAPAAASRIVVDEANRLMEIVLPDDQISLALGQGGQNVRLAAQLTGWRLDLNSESRVHALHEFARGSLCTLPGIDQACAETLYRHGFRQAKDIAQASPRLLALIPGIDPGLIARMQAAARARMEADQAELERIEREEERPIAEGSPEP